MTDLGDDYNPAEARINRVFDRLTSRLIGAIMSSAESAATAVADQLAKAKAEIDAVIAELKDQSVSDATVARLQNLAQALDDVNPDAPAEEPPADQPPAEEPVADGATDTSE